MQEFGRGSIKDLEKLVQVSKKCELIKSYEVGKAGLILFHGTV